MRNDWFIQLLKDYSIDDMSVVKMVPLTHHNVMADSINVIVSIVGVVFY